jgi:hypothetical protein
MLGIHFWRIFKEKHVVTNHPTQRNSIYIKIRECESCGKRQHHMMPKQNGQHYLWKDCKFGPDSIINFVKKDI